TVKGVNDNTRGNTFLRGSGKIKHSGHIFGTEAMRPNGGEFRLRGTYTDKTAENDIGNIQGSTFNGPAYFGADKSVTDGSTNNSAPFLYVRKQFGGNANKFYGKFGLESSIWLNGAGQKVEFYDDVYLNGAIRNVTNSKWAFIKKTGTTGDDAVHYPKLYYSGNAIYNTLGSIDANAWDNNTNVKKDENSAVDDITKMYVVPKNASDVEININDGTTYSSMPTDTILKKLNMVDEPASITINLDKIKNPEFPTTLTTVNGKTPGLGMPITGADLNAEYADQKNKNKLYRYSGMPSEEDGWMLLRLGNNPNATIFSEPNDNDAAFTGKMVLLIDGKTDFNATTNQYGAIGSNINLFISAENSNSLIVVEHERSAAQLGHNNLIRGLIVKRGDGQLNLKSTGPNMILRGAAYCVKGSHTTSNPSFRLEGGDKNILKIEYDPSVLKQIMKELPGVVCIENGKPCDSDSDSQLSDLMGDFSKISAVQVSRLF
ncbi:MAG: hypothetical protein FWF51_12255, partial [Chitinivibrionia bacterium]|nr:hypothetical protein [Chitinivibrionia bacterium]